MKEKIAEYLSDTYNITIELSKFFIALFIVLYVVIEVLNAFVDRNNLKEELTHYKKEIKENNITIKEYKNKKGWGNVRENQ